MRDPCECQVELDGIARSVEISFVPFKFVRYGGGGGHYGICVNVKLNLAIFSMDQYDKCVIFCYVDKKLYKLY